MVIWELAGRAEEDLSIDHNLRGRTSDDEMFEASIEKVCPEPEASPGTWEGSVS